MNPEYASPTLEAKLEAKATPNGWVYVIDRNYPSHEGVPPEAIIGAWKVNGDGEIVGLFQPNPNYRGIHR